MSLYSFINLYLHENKNDPRRFASKLLFRKTQVRYRVVLPASLTEFYLISLSISKKRRNRESKSRCSNLQNPKSSQFHSKRWSNKSQVHRTPSKEIESFMNQIQNKCADHTFVNQSLSIVLKPDEYFYYRKCIQVQWIFQKLLFVGLGCVNKDYDLPLCNSSCDLSKWPEKIIESVGQSKKETAFEKYHKGPFYLFII
jgi:hypothetical protein